MYNGYMRRVTLLLPLLLLVSACSKAPEVAKSEVAMRDFNASAPLETTIEFESNVKPKLLLKNLPNTYLKEATFMELPNWEGENYEAALESFIENCKSTKAQLVYKELCSEALTADDAKEFLEAHFKPYKIHNKEEHDKGLLTGYYEPHLHGSKRRHGRYIYPIYATPKDLITVELSSIYPALKNFRLRGRLEGNKLVPYYTREEVSDKALDAEVICYTDSRVDLFFLEIQGSGRVTLESGKTIFVGFDNQNGHRYRAIGRYMIEKGMLKRDEVSLQSIKKWLEENPSRVDEVLNYNQSVVYFKEKSAPASGSLGIELQAKRSVAVDKRYIPLGSMLYLNAKENRINGIVYAQDTGGAIKGAVRADLFLGYGSDAMQVAGRLKDQLELWILLPNRGEVL